MRVTMGMLRRMPKRGSADEDSGGDEYIEGIS
jgi:hypothetical protein